MISKDSKSQLQDDMEVEHNQLRNLGDVDCIGA